MAANREGAFLRLTSQGSSASVGGASSHPTLGYVNVNKTAASSSVNIYAGQNSTSGTLVAAIDTSATTGRNFTFEIRCADGIWANMQGGNADVTITYW